MGGGSQHFMKPWVARTQSHYSQLLPTFANRAPRHPCTQARQRRRRAHAHTAAPRPLNIPFHVLLVVGATGSPPAPKRLGLRRPAWEDHGVGGPRTRRAVHEAFTFTPNANSAYLIPAALPRPVLLPAPARPFHPGGRKHSGI